MSRPERIEQELPSIRAMLNYLVETGEKPESYGGVSQTVADQQRKGKYEEHEMPVYNGHVIAGEQTYQAPRSSLGLIPASHRPALRAKLTPWSRTPSRAL